MSDMIVRVANAIELAGEKVGAFYQVSDAEMKMLARAAIGEIRDVLSGSQNSSLAYTGDELDEELKRDQAKN